MKTAICAIIKDEHLYLEEWIEWHLGLGFNAIHLFEDKDSKSHEGICEKYSNVYLRRLENEKQVQHLLEEQRNSHRQFVLYDWFAREYKNEYDWTAFIDLDEFIVFNNEYDLNKLCKEFESYPAVLLNWRMMGASGHVKRPSCGVMEAYTKQSNFLQQDRLWMHKSFVNLKMYQGMANLHRAVGAVNTHYEEDFAKLHYDKAWLNHYFTKSWEDWCNRIFKRGGTVPAHRICGQFFDINTDMEYLRDELMATVVDKLPNSTFCLDRKRRTIAGGNLKKIADLCRPIGYKLIFDLGFYNGDTSINYLKKGHKVVGVECNPNLVSKNKREFTNLLANGSLTLINYCISNIDGENIKFYLSTNPVWSSCDRNIAEREDESQEIEVKSITLKTLIEIYGCPYYCKINIEGNDIIALQSILNTEYRPKVISCESQCYGKGETKSGLEALDKLHELGYTKYMLVNQRTNSQFRFEFNTEYPWVSYNEIKEQLLNIEDDSNTYGRRADIYATY